MPRRRAIPPPTQVTRVDVCRLVLNAIMIPLGITIPWRAASTGNLTTAALLLGLAFSGYGSYRGYAGKTRYRMYKDTKRKTAGITKDPRA